LELLVGSGPGDFKLSKNHFEAEFFGLKQDSEGTRKDWARVDTEKVLLLVINKEKYEEIIKNTELSASEKKIEFLLRYGPKLRQAGHRKLEEFEIFFIKE
jgi:hypothetical protein